MSDTPVRILPDAAVSRAFDDYTWQNFHQTVRQRCRRIDVYNPSGPASLGKYAMTTREIQRLIGEAQTAGQPLRALGSGWSFTDIAATPGHHLNTANLNFIIQPGTRSVSSAYGGDLAALLFVQCGVSISELNKYLEAPSRGRSLKTTGAANGQTVGGALGTGTHGSALSEGGFQRHVVSMHLIVGADRHVILEPETRPVASDWFANQIGAAIVRNDQWFNAALVSLGSFGVLHGVFIETRERFLLEANGTALPYDVALKRAINTADIGGLPVPNADEPPYFLEFTINPFDLGNVVATAMHARSCPASHVPNYAVDGELRPGLDTLGIVGMITDQFPDLTPILLGAAVGKLVSFGTYKGTWGEIFDYISHEHYACSASIGVNVEDATKVIDAILALQATIRAPALMSVRYVRPTGALLEMSRFPLTCAIGIDGAVSDRTMDLYEKVWTELDRLGIRYTHHWGKFARFSPTRVKKLYGAANVRHWQDARLALLGAAGTKTFSNPLTDRAGLS